MRRSTLPGLESLPIVIEPEAPSEASLDALLGWARAEGETLDRDLSGAGAFLFRGFNLAGPEDLACAGTALGGALQAYVGGDSPREPAGDRIYNSTEFPAHLPIGLHNELSYAGWWPRRIFFYCHVQPQSGGQTPIGDSRAIYRNMPQALRDRFETKGIRYIQNLHKGDGPAKSWQQTFETDDPAVVEAYCARHGMRYRWTEYGLSTSIDRPAVIAHPRTGEKAWFNQAEHWHAALAGVRFWDSGDALKDQDRLPAHCTYGDGDPITREDLTTVTDVINAAEIAFDWRRGDLLMLDNLITAHGRRPFAGERRILVAMA